MKGNQDRFSKFKTPIGESVQDKRLLPITGLALVIGLSAGVVSQIVTAMIGFVTNLSFFGRASTHFSSPSENHIGLWVLVVPVVGGIIVGIMARYGSKAIRGHGIPEAMEQVLLNQSRIPPRITILKPLSAAISIGTGGPFGAEGPIISTGGAMGSLMGQLLRTTADERKVLLAAGAAAGMSAIFGAPVSAVLLAIELLLFEFRSRSFIPVAIASVAATAVRVFFEGLKPSFSMPILPTPTEGAIVTYVLIGAATGLASVWITRAVYWIEDGFEKLPVHWMWWPAIGGVAVGVIGYFVPRTLGVGYDNISGFLSGTFTTETLLLLCAFKFLSWSIALGSGTSGGTLAPLFTIGGALGSAMAAGIHIVFPGIQIDLRMAGLIGMAAMFAGASRALLASVVFAFETTLQSSGLLPLLGGCSAAYLISTTMMKHTIMTEKIARRGLRVPSDYGPDHLARTLVRDRLSRTVATVSASQTIAEIRAWCRTYALGSEHGGFPVLDEHGELAGVVTRKEIFSTELPEGESINTLINRPPAVVFEDNTLREAADLMVTERIGRLPVVLREDPLQVVGILTRSDLLHAHESRLEEEHEANQTILVSSLWRGFKR
ncbi:MAG: chloride channel protein [Bacteroidota bacterium]|nr:chloride channel protein [Bacteroidota bacterium]MDP4233712.1 chloride channel protein [Bacteroidota bacterium]MDP4242351.1 chloride channel protein [Bacteroidota bacterium]MDP4288696.1 chloride channel protein [Bacteroidota bacterium]